MNALQDGDEDVGEPVGGDDGRAFVVGAGGEGHSAASAKVSTPQRALSAARRASASVL